MFFDIDPISSVITLSDFLTKKFGILPFEPFFSAWRVGKMLLKREIENLLKIKLHNFTRVSQ